MKAFIFFITFLVVYSISPASQTELTNVLSRNTKEWICEAPGLQCQSCETMQLCGPDKKSIHSIKCADQNPKLPYCDPDTNTCTAHVPIKCKSPASDFRCPGTGFYPDLLNCRKYYYCYDYGESVQEECPPGTIYHHNQQFCAPRGSCLSYSTTAGLCKTKINRFIPYTPNPNLFILCMLGQNPILLQCPSRYEEFNPSTITCIFQCKETGRFPYPGSLTKYYLCVPLTPTTFSKIVGECPTNYEFKNGLAVGQGMCQKLAGN